MLRFLEALLMPRLWTNGLTSGYWENPLVGRSWSNTMSSTIMKPKQIPLFLSFFHNSLSVLSFEAQDACVPQRDTLTTKTFSSHFFSKSENSKGNREDRFPVQGYMRVRNRKVTGRWHNESSRGQLDKPWIRGFRVIAPQFSVSRSWSWNLQTIINR